MIETMKQVCLLAMMLLLSCCATMVNGTTEQIAVKSEPAGAVVTVECGNHPLYGGLTPAVIIVERKAEPCALTVAKDGYVEEHIELKREISNATKVNKVPGSVLGTLLAVVGFAVTFDTGTIDSNIVGDAFEGGMYLGSEPGNAVDRRSGAAYKHVPGQVFVTLRPANQGG